MTVNYNFDDTLEMLLLSSRAPHEALSTRGYEVVYRPNTQHQKEAGVIYHPNGFLPSTFEDGASPEVIFADDSFQDQLIRAASGQYVQLSNFIFKNTCLLIGLSLEDTTLQHLLRQSAVSNPGHVHYIVHYVKDDKSYDTAAFEAIFEANFSAYNLYTLFLDSDGIRSLAELISSESGNLSLEYPEGKHKFVYYIIGSVGAGKSTASSNFCSLITYDEWIDERRSDMAVPETGFARQRIAEINRWVVEQFRKKNISLSKNPNGIHLVDRCPLDPLTFGEPRERKSKARNLYDSITNHGQEQIQHGHLIYLDADRSDLRNRMSYKHKYWSDRAIRKLQLNIQQVYGQIHKTIICTRGRTAREVARELAKVIFLGDYEEVDIGKQLQKHSGKSRP
jgi:hypothetical protein